MADLETRFRGLERTPAPDLWPDIEKRDPRPMPEPPRRRLVTAAVAFALATAGFAVAAVAFLGDGRVRPPGSPRGPVTPVVDTTVPVKWPGSIAYGEGSVWVSSLGKGGTGAGSIVRIDPETADVLAEIPVPVVPGWETGGGGLEVAEGSVWVAGAVAADGSPGSPGGGIDALVVRVDPDTNRVVKEIPLGGRSASDVAVDASGVWVTVFDDQEAPEVVRIDPTSGLVASRIPLRSDWARQIVAVDGAIWVHEHDGEFGRSKASTLTRIDPRTNEVAARLATGSDIFSITTSEGLIWLATYEGELLRIDPRANRLLEPVVGERLSSPALAAGEGGIWGQTSMDHGAAIVRLDTATGGVDALLRLPEDVSLIDMTVAPGSVWVVSYADEVIRIDVG